MPTADVIQRIAAVEPDEAETIARNETTFHEQHLPFYGRYRLLIASVALPYKVMTLTYADSDREIIPLGSPTRIYQVNAEEGLHLTETDVPAYTRFFFEHSGRHKPIIVEGKQELQWFPTQPDEIAYREARATAEHLIHPPLISQTAQGFLVYATALEQRALLELVLTVSFEGHVEVLHRQTLVDEIPVPYVGSGP
jgi:hypothetical protein